MNKIILPASSDGYTADDPNSGITDGLDGPAPRFRRDFLNNAITVAVTWNVNREGYNYLRAAYRYIEQSGNSPFLIDLITNGAQPVEHHAKFEVGSFRLASMKGHRYVVTAMLYALPTVKAPNMPNYPMSAPQ